MQDDLKADLERLAGKVGRSSVQAHVEDVMRVGRRLRLRRQLFAGASSILVAGVVWLLFASISLPQSERGPDRRSGRTAAAPVPANAIAFVGTSTDDPNDESIFVMNPDGSNVTKLSDSSSSDFYPAWSPDGTKLAFVSARAEGNVDVYVMNADGSAVTRVTTDPAIDTDPAWSPDGTKMVFARNIGGQDEIYIVNADGTSERRLTSNTLVEGNPTWSPDGKSIAFARNDGGNVDIWVMSADGTSPKRLTTNPSMDVAPAWSPDGTKLVFLRQGSDEKNELFLMNADGTAAKAITNDDLEKRSPSWSAVGAKILFSGGDPVDRTSWQVYEINPDGSDLRRITSLPEGAKMPASRP